MKRKAVGLAFICAAILSSYYLYRHIFEAWSSPESAPESAAATSSGVDPSKLARLNPGQARVWTCPMHPEIVQDHPGTCPICGMDLVEAKEGGAHEHGVHVDTASVQKLGVKLAKVSRLPLGDEIRTYGYISADGHGQYAVHSFYDGLIKKSYIHSVGQRIEKGQPMYEIYSPELIMRQKELLSFEERRDQILQTVGDANIFENMYVMDLLKNLSVEREKFLYQNVGLDTVKELEDTKFPIQIVKIVAPETGVVTRINAREGTNVNPSAELFTLADVSKVWVDLTLYPDQVARVKVGDMVSVKTRDGKAMEAVIDFVSPVADADKVTARATLNNKNHLRPGSFADVTIHTGRHEALALPRSAILHNGIDDMVMLSRGDGHFLPVPVETGVESGELVEIADGLQEGAEVAVNGQFLLDAAASIHDTQMRMRESHVHK
jgi:membrane fusion protein, copper/silver efflux system